MPQLVSAVRARAAWLAIERPKCVEYCQSYEWVHVLLHGWCAAVARLLRDCCVAVAWLVPQHGMPLPKGPFLGVQVRSDHIRFDATPISFE